MKLSQNVSRMYYLPVGLLIIVGNALKSAQINKEKSKWEKRPFWNDDGNFFDSQECIPGLSESVLVPLNCLMNIHITLETSPGPSEWSLEGPGIQRLWIVSW